MTAETRPVSKNDINGKHAYMILCVASLGALVMTQVTRPDGPVNRDLPLPLNMLLSLLVLAVGALGIFGNMRSSPLFILLILAAPALVSIAYRVLYWLQAFGPNQNFFGSRNLFRSNDAISLTDLISSCALLGFTIGHYRLLSLSQNIFPIDTRQRKETPGELQKPWHRRKKYTPVRSTALVSVLEIAVTLLMLPVFVIVAQLLWSLVAVNYSALEMSRYTIRFILVGWLMLIPGLILSSLFRLWRQYSINKEQAQLILQDSLWQENRREQRRIQRWLVWQKWNRQQKDTP